MVAQRPPTEIDFDIEIDMSEIEFVCIPDECALALKYESMKMVDGFSKALEAINNLNERLAERYGNSSNSLEKQGA